MKSKVVVLDYRQERLEKDFSEAQFKLEIVCFKVQKIAIDQLRVVQYVSLEIGQMLIKEANMNIRFERISLRLRTIERSNANHPVRRGPPNPSLRMLCDAPQNAIVPSPINERMNSENRLNRSSPQNPSVIKSFFYSVRDFIYSSAEVAVFFLSLGFFRRSFTLEESNSCVEKLEKVGRNFSRLARFVSVEFRQNIHAFSIHNELHVNINNTSNINNHSS